MTNAESDTSPLIAEAMLYVIKRENSNLLSMDHPVKLVVHVPQNRDTQFVKLARSILGLIIPVPYSYDTIGNSLIEIPLKDRETMDKFFTEMESEGFTFELSGKAKTQRLAMETFRLRDRMQNVFRAAGAEISV